MGFNDVAKVACRRRPEWWYEELDKSSPQKTIRKMDKICKNNNSHTTLEIEQEDTIEDL